jgi:murein L,D-transpeptidase YafK
VKSYPVVFGANPVDDKHREGDRCTPEGRFKIDARYPHRLWNKFMLLSYPTAESWRKFKEAKRSGKLRASATIGGNVGIHGVPEGRDDAIDSRTNWTLGCISLKNADVDELYSVVRKGTAVEITH